MYDADTLRLMGLPPTASMHDVSNLTSLPDLGFHLDLAKRAIDSLPIPPARLLDLGCGLGGLAAFISDTYKSEYIGIDISFEFLGEAVRRTRQKPRQAVQQLFAQADLRVSIPIDFSWPELVVTGSIGDLFGDVSHLLRTLSSWTTTAPKLLLMESFALPAVADSVYQEKLSILAESVNWKLFSQFHSEPFGVNFTQTDGIIVQKFVHTFATIFQSRPQDPPTQCYEC